MIKSSITQRIIGLALIVIGVTLVSNPELLSNKPVPADTFEAIERRIWWGLFIGIGTLLLFRHQLKPWLATLAAACVSIVFGLLMARLLGIMLDGSVAKQWLYVGIEVVILVPLVWWYLKVRT